MKTEQRPRPTPGLLSLPAPLCSVRFVHSVHTLQIRDFPFWVLPADLL